MALFVEESKYKSNWREEYEKKVVPAEQALKVVRSGDFVIVPFFKQPEYLMSELVKRAPELKNVTVSMAGTTTDLGFVTEQTKESFHVFVETFIGTGVRKYTDSRQISFLPALFSKRFKGVDEKRPESEKFQDNILLTIVSPPDENGFCSFGETLWHKRSYAKRARCIIAEIDEKAIRTFGNNYIHVSEIDYFVKTADIPALNDGEWENLYKMFPHRSAQVIYSTLKNQPANALRNILEFAQVMGYEVVGNQVAHHLMLNDPDEVAIAIAKHLKTLVKNGATIQVGVGRPSMYMITLGVFDDSNDLGIHTEMGAPGMPLLVKKGIVTGKYKTLHQGKAVFSTLSGCLAEDIEFAHNNPTFELYDSEYVVNINTISGHDNMLAVNNTLQVDLTGQAVSECQPGGRMINGNGGQPEFHIGSFYSRGGRAVLVLPSTKLGVSTIVPQLEKGTFVTIPRQFADTIITEYGVACLLDKTHRERAEELISIAHPDHRDFLRDEARRIFG